MDVGYVSKATDPWCAISIAKALDHQWEVLQRAHVTCHSHSVRQLAIAAGSASSLESFLLLSLLMGD